MNERMGPIFCVSGIQREASAMRVVLMRVCVMRGGTHATRLPMKKIATIATTMPMITKVGLDFSSAIILLT